MRFRKWMVAAPLVVSLFVAQSALADTQTNLNDLIERISGSRTILDEYVARAVQNSANRDAKLQIVNACIAKGHNQKDNQQKIAKVNAEIQVMYLRLGYARTNIFHADDSRRAAAIALAIGNTTGAQSLINDGHSELNEYDNWINKIDILDAEIDGILAGMVFPAGNCAGGGGGSSSSAPMETCGDEVVEGSDEGDETCDEAAVDTATCDADCTDAFCGDTYVNAELSETCDDGNTDDDDYCSADCTDVTGYCGDETVQSDMEGCDEGGVDTAECNSDCTESYCSDGYTNTEAGEECDDGNAEDDDGCSALCVTEYCGDEITQESEECDDGNTENEDGCSATCTIEE